jgi:hypothetical protein
MVSMLPNLNFKNIPSGSTQHRQALVAAGAVQALGVFHAVGHTGLALLAQCEAKL